MKPRGEGASFRSLTERLATVRTLGRCQSRASTEIIVDIWCSLSAASRTRLSAMFPVSTQTMPRREVAKVRQFLETLAPPAIFDGAPRLRVEVYAVGLRPDGD